MKLPGSNNYSPIFLCGKDQSELAVLRLALEGEGFRLRARVSDNNVPNLDDHPLSVLACGSRTRIDRWLDYVKRGGTLILLNPNNDSAPQFGLKDYQGTSNGGLLSLSLIENEEAVHIQIVGAASKYGHVPGSVKGSIRKEESSSKKFPGIVEYAMGRGKVLILLFSLARLITYFHQRTEVLASETGGGSAEKIALSGVNKGLLSRPQLDVLLGFLTRFMVEELSRLDKPIPRFGHLPSGYRSIVTFSFDDFCPSGRPIRQAAANLMIVLRKTNFTAKKLSHVFTTIRQLFEEICYYKDNYQSDVTRLVSLFKKYGASASAFVLPFFAFIKNRPGFTGYRGFSKKTFDLLKNAGWDVGTHIRPLSLNDYTVSKQKFKTYFRTSPLGHRGHQLGWVDWDKDWQRLENLGYVYDATWNWGGHNRLSWILGTSSPFHPVDRNGYPLSILEVPVVGWIEDMYKTPEESIRHIENCLDLYPGLFSFAGHSWRVKEKAYIEFIEQIIAIAKTKSGVGVGFTLHEICEFLTKREQSKIEEVCWDNQDYVLSFVTDSNCGNHDLTVCIPYTWKNRKIDSIYIQEKKAISNLQKLWGVRYATITIKSGCSHVRVKYS